MVGFYWGDAMSLLDNMPHLCTIRRRKHTKGGLGGTKATYQTVQTGVACWEQSAGDSRESAMQKKGMAITHKVYFKTNPNVTGRFQILITQRKNRDGSITTIGDPLPLDVLSIAVPDMAAGLGVVYRVLCGHKTTEND
jgi:hypothetical protein